MNKGFLRIVITILIFNVSCTKTPTNSDSVLFSDTNFETLIREVLNKSSGIITPEEMLNITTVDGNERHISDISGIEYCLNLKELYLEYNQIIDISALSELEQLEKLDLGRNYFVDIGTIFNQCR